MYNISARGTRGLQLYFSSALLYGLGIIIFQNLPYYQQSLLPETQWVLLGVYILYVIFAPLVYYFRITPTTENKPFLIFQWMIRLVRTKTWHTLPEEKTAFLFILVKLFFLPLLVNFSVGNSTSLTQINGLGFYPFILVLLFAIDTIIFALGYLFEAKATRNIVKSVDATFSGWLVALICYPPFNTLIGTYVPWGANDHVFFWNDTFTFFMRGIIVLLLIIYVWATLALGLKASNLTNRGIVRRFPYSFVRHPAYISKNLVWWITMLPVLHWKFAVGMAFWSIVYGWRAVTEERHLSKDPEYVAYAQTVRWKFIPYIY